MARTSKRTNALLEAERVARLRESLDFRSNSEAVARGIDDRLAAERGLKALRELRRLGGPEDVFGRTSQKRKCPLIPQSQLWALTEPHHSRIEQALAWAAENSAKETDLSAFEDHVRQVRAAAKGAKGAEHSPLRRSLAASPRSQQSRISKVLRAKVNSLRLQSRIRALAHREFLRLLSLYPDYDSACECSPCLAQKKPTADLIYIYTVMKCVKIAKLRTHLSEYLRTVRGGESVTILDRETPIAKIVPVQLVGLRIQKPPEGTPAPNRVPLPPPLESKIDIVTLLLEQRQAQR